MVQTRSSFRKKRYRLSFLGRLMTFVLFISLTLCLTTVALNKTVFNVDYMTKQVTKQENLNMLSQEINTELLTQIRNNGLPSSFNPGQLITQEDLKTDIQTSVNQFYSNQSQILPTEQIVQQVQSSLNQKVINVPLVKDLIVGVISTLKEPLTQYLDQTINNQKLAPLVQKLDHYKGLNKTIGIIMGVISFLLILGLVFKAHSFGTWLRQIGFSVAGSGLFFVISILVIQINGFLDRLIHELGNYSQVTENIVAHMFEVGISTSLMLIIVGMIGIFIGHLIRKR